MRTGQSRVIMKILVIDDDQIQREIVLEMLEELEIESYEAENGIEAIEILKADNNFNLIITDLMMPKLGGIELLYELRKFKIPLITLSGLMKDVVIEELLASLGILAVMQKPFSLSELQTTIKDSLKKIN